MRLIAVCSCIIMLAALMSCGESTGPEAPFSVVVSVAASTEPAFVDFDTLPRIECFVTLRAVAHGPGTATWGDGTFYVYIGPDRATPVDSGAIPAATIRQSWGAATIDSTAAHEAQWDLSASIPFELAFVFTYSKSNGPVVRTPPVRASCGPSIPPGTSPPKIANAATNPAGGEIQNGDTLTVSYDIGSTIGIWESRIELSGSCAITRVFPEHLVHSAMRSVPIVIPPACAPGTTLLVGIEAFDAAGQGVQGQIASLSVVDHTRPRAGVLVDWLYDSPLGRYVLGDDSLLVSVFGADNNALRGVFWKREPGGSVDSLMTGLPNFGRQMTIPAPDSSPTKIVMRAWSRDAAGLVSDTALAPADSVRVIPNRHHSIRESVVIPPIAAMTVAERRGMVYVIVANPPEILGISLQSMVVTDTIRLASAPADIDVTAGEDSLVVSLPADRAIGVIDLSASARTVALLSLPSMAAGSVPSRVRTLANDHAFILVSGDVVNQTLLELDLGTGVDRVRTDVGASGFVGAATLQRSFDHRVVALVVRGAISAGLQRYDVGTNAFGSSVNYGLGFEPALDGTGAHIAIGTTAFDAALNVEKVCETPAVGRGPYVSALSFDGSILYHTMGPFGLLRDSVASGQLVERTRLPFNVPYHLAVTSDGKMVILYEEPYSRIAVIDLP